MSAGADFKWRELAQKTAECRGGQHRYDHRLRELVRLTGDVEYAIQRGVPRSTARGWLTANRAEVVTVDVVDMDALRLQQEVLELRSPAVRHDILDFPARVLAILSCGAVIPAIYPTQMGH